MKTEWLYKTISLAIIVVLFYLLYKVFSPFLITIAWAMVLSITFYPLNNLFLRRIKRPWLASLITLIIILAIMMGPFAFITGTLINEITGAYSAIEEKGLETVTRIQSYPELKAFFEKLASYKIFEGFDFQQSAVESLKSIGSMIAGHTTDFFKNAVLFIVNFFIICLTTYYFLKDGNTLVNYIKKLLPFSETQKDRLEQRVRELVVAGIYGGLAVGAAQGVLGGIAFFAFRLPSPVFWGTVMAVFSFIPVIGCAAVWVPAGMFLLITGSFAKGIGFFVYCVVLIASVDNVIRPLVIGGRTKLHTLLVFFSVLGGINYLGFLGFVLGPLIAALCLSLMEIYTLEENEQEDTAGS